MQLGYHLSSEELDPRVMPRLARRAEDVGFDFVTISDHFHPWTRAQAQSPFVWGAIGAIAAVTERVEVATCVTWPTMRMHPAIVAHAAATAAVQLEGRFVFGVGTGERLNEVILGDPWPPAPVRRAMLEEAIEVMRALWTGEMVRAHEGEHYTVHDARLFTVPEEPPPIVVSAFGPHAARLAGRVGDGFWNVAPDPELLGVFHDAGGHGKPAYGKLDTSVAEDDATARRIALETWPTSTLGGEIGQQLATPEHYEQAAARATEEQVAEGILCSNDAERHVAAIREYLDAGYDRVHVQQCGQDQDRLLDLYEREVLPALR
ncbi:MAG TPA: TIGR03557 family F420-dependent LLM class oxidoreductase [Solirubrobacteraceae bacterium]|nr:TIGR03557 family F420-dependent LLM class oxidoreductase [Solirubrobacteraceae bacterium]